MKKIFLTGVLLVVLNFAQATTITSGITGTGAFDGTYGYLWEIGPISLAAGQQITSASITFTGIKETVAGSGNDISVDVGSIFSGMSFLGTGTGVLNNKLTSVPTTANTFRTYTDNDVKGDAFANNITAGKALHLGTETFPALNVTHNFTFTFTTNELAALNGYITGLWGFEIDPDCHFNVGAISFTYNVGSTNKVKAPEAPATAVLLGLAFLGMFIVRRKIQTNFVPTKARSSGSEKLNCKIGSGLNS